MDTTRRITAAERKLIASLAKAKNRRELGLFAVEGTKCVPDTIDHFNLRYLVATQEWYDEHGRSGLMASPAEMERMSSLATAPAVIAVYEIPACEEPVIEPDKLYLALDCIQDPGNLGTIVRTADWMGVDTILASHDTADIYSAKAAQATMGALSRVRVHYCDLAAELGHLAGRVPVYGTFLGGENIYKADLPGAAGVIVMGNEGRGISPEVAARVTRRLTIPSFPPGRPTSESLNVGIATAIVLSVFRQI